MSQLNEAIATNVATLSAARRDAASLVRGLGLWAATAAVVGAVIGSGIFLVGSEVARDPGSASLALGAWIGGGLLSLCGALCLAELGAAMPRAGGIYAYLTRGLGPVWGFLYGWTSSTVIETGANAAIAAGFVRLVGFLEPAAVRPLFTLHISAPFHAAPYEFVFSAAQPLAAGVIVLLTAINYLSIRSGGHIQLVATSLKISSIAAIIVLGLVSRSADFAALLPASTHLAAGTAGAFLAALVPVMWAFSGWHLLGAVGEEVENPAENFPRALAYGMGAVLVIYVLVNWVFLRVLAFGNVAASSAVASDAFRKMLGDSGAKWLTIAMMISVLGTLHINLLASARIPFAMARDGLFFRFTARVQPVFRSPSGGLLFMGGLAGLLALSGTFEELVSLTVFVGGRADPAATNGSTRGSPLFHLGLSLGTASLPCERRGHDGQPVAGQPGAFFDRPWGDPAGAPFLFLLAKKIGRDDRAGTKLIAGAAKMHAPFFHARDFDGAITLTAPSILLPG